MKKFLPTIRQQAGYNVSLMRPKPEVLYCDNIKTNHMAKRRTLIERVALRLLLLVSLPYNLFLVLKKWKQVRAFYSTRKDFLSYYSDLARKDISVFLTPHWEILNSKLEAYVRKSNMPLSFLRNKILGYAMFAAGGGRAMSVELGGLRKMYSNKELKNLLEEEAVGIPIITDLKHRSSHNNVRHLHHIARFVERTKVDINSVNSVLEWGGGYGNFARIFLKVRKSSIALTYTVIDTPLFSCIQWLYLSAVLGEDIVPLGFIEKIKTTPDLFVSIWALSESSAFSQDYVSSKKFWFAKHLLVVYQESNKDLPDAGRLGGIIESNKNVIKERVAYMSYPSYYLFN